MALSTSLTLTRKQAHELDQLAADEYGISSLFLMENAGRGIAEYLLSQQIQGQIAVFCGKGNNAGDGFVIARHLNNHQIPVQVLLFAKPEALSKDAKTNYDSLIRSGISIADFSEQNIDEMKLQEILTSADWVVDALLGTGLQGVLRPPFDKVISVINAYAKNIIAVDIPSGLDCDLGNPLGVAIKAQHTLTFVAMKKGFTNPEAQPFLGNIMVLDIGIPCRLLERITTPNK